MSDPGRPAAVEGELRALVDHLDLEAVAAGGDGGTADLDATLRRACEDRPEEVGAVLDRLAAELRDTEGGSGSDGPGSEEADPDPAGSEGTDPDPAGSEGTDPDPAGSEGTDPDVAGEGDSDLGPETAARLLFGLVEAAGSELHAADPGALWRALDVVRARSGDDGPVGVYARAAAHAWPFPDDPNATDAIPVEAVASRLGDPEGRRPAAFLCARRGIPGGLEAAVADCLDDPDDEVRRWAAKALDYGDVDPTPFADRLLEATDDEVPEVRAAATGALCLGLRDLDPVPDWAGPAMAGLADALEDDAVVRLRAVGVLDPFPSHLAESDAWQGLDPGTRGRIGLGTLGVTPDETASDRSNSGVAGSFFRPLSSKDVWAVEDDLFEVGWPGEDRSREFWRPHRGARRRLASAALDDPHRLSDPGRYVAAITDRSAESGCDVAEARILRAVAGRDPDAVTEGVPALLAALDPDDPGDASRESARTLARIADRRPDAVPVGRAELVAAVGDVVRDGYLKPERLAALSVVDPEAAAEALREVCESVEEYGNTVGQGIDQVAEADPAVLLGAVDEAVAALSGIEGSRLGSALAGLATAAAADPERIAPHAPAVAPYLSARRRDVRAAAADLLATVGEDDPGALPPVARPLVGGPSQDGDPGGEDGSGAGGGGDGSAADPDDPAWPAGTVARADPDAGRRLVGEATEVDDLDDYFGPREYGRLLAEVTAGSPEVGREVAGWLAAALSGGQGDRPAVDGSPVVPPARELDPGAAVRLLGTLAEDHPDVVAPHAPALLGALSSGRVGPGSGSERVTNTLARVVAEHPGVVGDAVSTAAPAEFDPDAYGQLVSDVATAAPEAGEELLDRLFDAAQREASAAEAVKKFVQADPEAATPHAERIVATLAHGHPADEWSFLRSLTWMAVNADPAPVREALAAHFPDRESFVAHVDHRRAEDVAEKAGFRTGDVDEPPEPSGRPGPDGGSGRTSGSGSGDGVGHPRGGTGDEDGPLRSLLDRLFGDR